MKKWLQKLGLVVAFAFVLGLMARVVVVPTALAQHNPEDGCLFLPYTFANDTKMGMCRGLAATWFFDSLVITAEDWETQGYGALIQLAPSSTDPGFVFLSVDDSDLNGASLSMQHPGGVTPWANFVLYTGEFTTGTGALVTIDGTATTAGVGTINLTVASNPDSTGNNVQVLTGETNFSRPIRPIGVAFASLGTPTNGTFDYCSDCTTSTGTTCAGSGTGALAVRLNGAWQCFE